MIKSVLTIPAWMLFIAFFLGATAADVAASMIGKNLGWDLDYGAFPTLRFGLISLVWWSYPYLVGRRLSQQSMAGSRPTSHRAILLIALVAIVNNALGVYLAELFGVLWYVVIVTIVLNFLCTLWVFAFPAIELKSWKLGREARAAEAWIELIQFMLWPLCVWWVQPTLKDIAVRNQVATGRS